MDKTVENNVLNLASHNLSIKERKHIAMSGIKKIISFDSEEFLMESSMGNILLKGEGLEIVRLDTHDGNVSIKGYVNQITYLDSKEKVKEDGIIAKLFK